VFAVGSVKHFGFKIRIKLLRILADSLYNEFQTEGVLTPNTYLSVCIGIKLSFFHKLYQNMSTFDGAVCWADVGKSVGTGAHRSGPSQNVTAARARQNRRRQGNAEESNSVCTQFSVKLTLQNFSVSSIFYNYMTS